MIVETSKGKLPVRYGMNALAMYGDMINKPMNDVMSSLGNTKKMRLSDILAFVYVGFVDGARYHEQKCAVKNVTEVGDMLDDDPDLLNKMLNAYGEQAGASEEGGGSKKV